jgi:hypothetical protein
MLNAQCRMLKAQRMPNLGEAFNVEHWALRIEHWALNSWALAHEFIPESMDGEDELWMPRVVFDFLP